MSSELVPAPSREVVSPSEDAAAPEVPAAKTLVCANCDAPLAGEYCSRCGQKHEPHLHKLSHFAGEAFESLTHADSRLWRTLGYLLTRPGRLTQEFFSGRRARQLPPFRLYLVISVFFFLVAGMPGVRSGDTEKKESGTPSSETVEGLNSAADSIKDVLPESPGKEKAIAKLRARAAEEQAKLDAAAKGLPAPASAPGAGADKDADTDDDRNDVNSHLCTQVDQPAVNPGPGNAMLASFCKKLNHMSGRELIKAIVHNIPRAMFVFLPLLAVFMKLLYWRPKRYYVEHLLFLVHNHAFVFLAFAIMAVLMKLPLGGNVLGFLQAAIWLYVFWYIFRAMRVYYAQSRALTFAKYTLIGFTYVSTSVVVLTLTAIFTALTLGD